MSLSASSSGAGSASSVSRSSRASIASTTRGTVAVAVLQQQPRAGAQRRLGEPAELGLELAGHLRRVLGGGEQVAAGEVDLVGRADRHRQRRRRPRRAPVERPHAGDARAGAGGQRRRPRRPGAARRRRAARVAADSPPSVAQHELHRAGAATRRRRARRAARRVSRCSSSGGPAYQGSRGRALDDVVAVQRADRQEVTSRRRAARLAHAAVERRRTMRSKTSSDQPTRSILLTATTTWRTRSSAAIAAWRRVCSITPLRASTSTIATSAVEAPVTMLRVYCSWPGRVGEDEAPPRRREVAVARRRS